jgi:glucose/arabinose dehydrogenase|tara:strand:- start:413 stop:1732 length:1320 start_codon:yes stop_codon:yes gene_type:complete
MRNILMLFIFIGGFLNAQHQVGSTTLEEREVVDGLDVPWEIKWGPDNFLWVTERSGLVSRIDVETGEKYIILDISDDIYDSNEAGLLGMEIHPDFNNGSPYVFLAYTYVSQGAKEKIVYYEYDFDADALINEEVLLDGIDGNSTHIGCRLMALDDLTMLITTGDAQEWLLSEDVTELTGKTLRMSINMNDGTVGQPPLDNPISGNLVWSWGHRNAQGLAMGPNGIIYSSEHGPSNDDELNILVANSNYGWPNVQGYCDNQWVDYGYAEYLSGNYTEIDYCNDNNVVDAIWSSGSTTIAPSDIIWYDHPSIPEFQNSLLMTVLKNKMLVRFEFSDDGQEMTSYTELFNNEWGRLRDICVSPDGKIYLATNGYSWPSQGPNEIIELYNPDFDYTVDLIDYSINSKVLYSFDYLGRKVEKNKAGFIIHVYDNGKVEKAYVLQ